MRLRQSQIKTFQECSLKYRWAAEGYPREQSSALSWGTALHDAVFVMENAQSLDIGQQRFLKTWQDLSILDIEYDYLMPYKSHDGYRDEGLRILRDWWFLIQWETDIVVAREHHFVVPFGRHELEGTADKVVLRQLKGGEWVVLVSDYKTGAKAPTRDYLAHDLQFTVYCYASTQPEFWANIPDGERMFEQYKTARRFGEWVHLRSPKRIDAGVREQYHYNRLAYAADAIEMSVSLGIFVPQISGASCEYCPYRKPCGLPSRIEEGLE